MASAEGTPNKIVQANRLKRIFVENKGPAIGVWQSLPGANLSRVLAQTGVDWVLVDAEHGNIDDAAMHESVPAISALGVSPIVRIPGFESWMVKRALDSGAHGILVPLIRTVAEVKDLVAAARFPPQGCRGFGSLLAMQNFSTPVVAAGGATAEYGKPPTFFEYLQQANEGTLVIVQIETREALEAVDEIAALVDVLFVGPFDLGNSIGHPFVTAEPPAELREAIARVLRAAKRAGTKAGVYCSSGEEAKAYADMGFDMLSCGLDIALLKGAMVANVAKARGQGAPGRAAGGY